MDDYETESFAEKVLAVAGFVAAIGLLYVFIILLK
jgi:hypothetical protein